MPIIQGARLIMIYRCEVATFFDCSNTGVVSYRRGIELDQESWIFKRNQQRNWETLLQCISLRCQPLNISPVSKVLHESKKLYWTFTFETDRESIFATANDPMGLLKKDCNGVPMIVGLEESEKELFLTPYLITHGSACNIFFNPLTDK